MTAVFSAYARYYDLLYSDKDYAAEAAYIATHIRRCNPVAVRILELGCGTGVHAEHMARQGFWIDGLDISDAMLAKAKWRLENLQSDLAERLFFDYGDARTARTGKVYDAVIALFHVVSYQTNNVDLKAILSTAAAHLAPGGLFLFDYWNGPAVLKQRPEIRIRRIEDDAIRVTRIAEPQMDPELKIVDVNFSIFVETKADGSISQLREKHPMRYLFAEEITQLASEKFTGVGHYAWMTGHPSSADCWSALSIMTKN